MTDSQTHSTTELDSSSNAKKKNLELSVVPSIAGQLQQGQFDGLQLMPYPEPAENSVAAGDSMVAKTRLYCDQFVHADRIDQHSLLAPGIVKGMGNLDVLGMIVSKSLGGYEMSVVNFCRVMETLGGHCGSTAAMVRMQSCVILRLLQNFGSSIQQQQWMPSVITGDKTGALAITEKLAGLDIANIHTSAKPNASGGGFRLSGEKRWIANGADADLLVVLARTPDDYSPAGNVSAFLVPTDRPGITIQPVAATKLGLRGVSIATIQFDSVAVAEEDLIGEKGAALAMVQSVETLDRIAYAASTIGLVKALLEAMVTRSRTRRQFGKTIGHFKQVKHKIARVASNLYALESAVYLTAAQYHCDLCDAGRLALDSKLLKLFASESAWTAVNDAMDIWGGKSLFNDQPLERVFRDVRHGLIAEGSNDLLRQSIALADSQTSNQTSVGAYAAGASNTKRSWWQTGAMKFPASPAIEVKHEHLRFHSRWLSSHIGKLGALNRSPSTGDALRQQRIADLTANLFFSSCVYSKLSALMVNGTIPDPPKRFAFDTGSLFLQAAKQKNQPLLDQLKINLDQVKSDVADQWLGHEFADSHWPRWSAVEASSASVSASGEFAEKTEL